MCIIHKQYRGSYDCMCDLLSVNSTAISGVCVCVCVCVCVRVSVFLSDITAPTGLDDEFRLSERIQKKCTSAQKSSPFCALR